LGEGRLARCKQDLWKKASAEKGSKLLTQKITIPRRATLWKIGSGVAVAPGEHDELEMDWRRKLFSVKLLSI
jgi:hypothetical protein